MIKICFLTHIRSHQIGAMAPKTSHATLEIVGQFRYTVAQDIDPLDIFNMEAIEYGTKQAAGGWHKSA